MRSDSKTSRVYKNCKYDWATFRSSKGDKKGPRMARYVDCPRS